MINIYRTKYNNGTYDPDINVFHGRDTVEPQEVRLVRRLFGDEEYLHAEPAEPGWYAHGGTFLYTSNGIHPKFNKPIPLHDRDMSKER